jgi:thiol-disulfide isomerase/thioredoxin
MRHARPLFLASLLLVSGVAAAQTKPAANAEPASAEALLESAKEKARAEGKNVLVLFHASWCKWCKKMEAFMDKPEFKPFFEDNFVPVWLTVYERGEELKNENPGANDVLTWLGGNKMGIPFFAVLNSDGKLLMNSVRKPLGTPTGQNIGFPAAPEEIEHFVTMLKTGAPKATPEQLDALRAFLANPEA